MINFVHFFPVPFFISLLILAGALWLSRRKGCAHLLGLAVFGLYAMTVVYLMYFPFPIPEDWPANLTRRGMLESLADVNLVPFNFSATAGFRRPFLRGMSDVVLNVLLTVPLGMGLSFLFRPRWWGILLAALAAGLAFEGSQLFFKAVLGVFFHSVDTTDVITNASGVLAGAGIYYAAAALARRLTRPAAR